ncbi:MULTISPECIES: RidA family protein [Tritonibacter]|uniref:Enamine deaminase RidA (YjgF/YER057c/UK114 family) n=1 Tax=Tritonibacter scottomollicae TaxID=483013 RepID=A0A2T1AP82_TRISK|nr:RidA family protein [Tritonibacter scottomollicae]PRZ50415.1 enamine deaminase RidA (YjgF/YER057c/UK114 family) [Tritonibacter scottomollicae]WOI35179.1 RidA family protein [Tritonibacter scottomollicae]
MTHQTIHPEGWAPAKGYANGMLTQDGVLHIGGQIGWDEKQEFASDSFVDQMRQALKNIRSIVEAAGGKASDVTRLTWFVIDKQEYLAHQAEVGAAYREVFGKHFPAMSMLIVAGLVEDRALVEIEATAHIS